jgi:MFS family permease
LKLATKIGQKVSLCLAALPQILGWLFIYYARNPFYLIASRILSGFGGGGLYSIVPSYISEISDDKVRGTLGSTVVFSCNFGMFVVYVLGEYVSYSMIPWLMVPVSFAFLILFMTVPDSPTYLAKRNLYDVSFLILNLTIE